MTRLASIFALLGIGAISLFAVTPVLAMPPLPSSFYGTVKINGANVPDGTIVQVSINGTVVSKSQIRAYQGDSIYSVDIPGDDPDTSIVEGGKDGDTIAFTLGGIVADQTGIWKSGTIVSLNLTASSAGTQIPVQATVVPVPTQTAIILIVATATPLTMETQPAPTNAVLDPGLSLPTAEMPATLTIPVVANPEEAPAVSKTTNLHTGIVIAGFIVFIIILLIILWLVLKRKPKAE